MSISSWSFPNERMVVTGTDKNLMEYLKLLLPSVGHLGVCQINCLTKLTGNCSYYKLKTNHKENKGEGPSERNTFRLYRIIKRIGFV